MTKKQKPYIVYVKGESESDWRGADPESITPLLESQGEKNTAGLHFKIITSQVEMLLQMQAGQGQLSMVNIVCE